MVAKYLFVISINIGLLVNLYWSTSAIRKWGLLPIITFILIVIHSLLLSTDVLNSLERALFSLLFVSAATFLVSNFPNDSLSLIKRFIYVSGIFWVIGCFVAMIGFTSSSYHAGNFRGFTNNSNYLALYLSVFVTPSFITKIVRSRRLSASFFLNLVLFFAVLLIIIETRSRASILVVVVMLLLQLNYSNLIRGVPVYRKRLLLCFVALASIFSLLNVGFIADKYSTSEGTLVESVFSTRAIMYDYRIQGITERPWLGWGYSINSMEGRMTEPWVFNEYEKGTTPLAVVEEFGIVLGGLLLLVLLKIGIASFRGWPQDPIVCSIVLGALVHSLFETWLFNFNSYYCWIFWICVVKTLTYACPPVMHNPFRVLSSQFHQ